MKTVIVLLTFTTEGIKAIKESPSRAEAFTKRIEKSGCSVKGLYWTFGYYDGVLIIDAPDDETAQAAILGLAHAGNVTTKTLQAVNAEAMKSMLSQLP